MGCSFTAAIPSNNVYTPVESTGKPLQCGFRDTKTWSDVILSAIPFRHQYRAGPGKTSGIDVQCSGAFAATNKCCKHIDKSASNKVNSVRAWNVVKKYS